MCEILVLKRLVFQHFIMNIFLKSKLLLCISIKLDEVMILSHFKEGANSV